MTPFARFALSPTLAACLLSAAQLLVAPTAIAQYKWTDENGRVIYSDRPPLSAPGPITTLRPPARPPAAAAPGTAPAPAGQSTATGDVNADAEKRPSAEPSAPRTLAEREQAMRKRLQEREKAERKAEDDARRAAELARACQDRAADLRVLESGARIATVDGRGERSFMSEEQVAGRADALRRALAEECRRGG